MICPTCKTEAGDQVCMCGVCPSCDPKHFAPPAPYDPRFVLSPQRSLKGSYSGFGKTGYTLPSGEVVVTSEGLYASHWLSVSRHSTYCNCSFCDPWSMKTYKRLPKPGRFGIDVPPRENPYRWTHIHLRLGKWIYYVQSQIQFFPSVWPFFHAEEWEEKTCEVQRSDK